MSQDAGFPEHDEANPFDDLREQLFKIDAATAPADDGAETGLIGVVVEEGLDKGSYLVFGLRDGSASVYFSTGGGSIGGQGKPRIKAAAKQLVEAALPQFEAVPVSEDLPLPTEGRVRLSFLTVDGVRSTDVDGDELKGGGHALVPVFAAAHEIISEFRELSEPTPADESSYTNCLLTAIARGNGASATLTDGATPPDPLTLTEDPVDREWIEDLGFALDQLSANAVIQQIRELTKFGMMGLSKEGRIAIKLANHGGETLSDVAFRVRRSKKSGRDQLEIGPAR